MSSMAPHCNAVSCYSSLQRTPYSDIADVSTMYVCVNLFDLYMAVFDCYYNVTYLVIITTLSKCRIGMRRILAKQ